MFIIQGSRKTKCSFLGRVSTAWKDFFFLTPDHFCTELWRHSYFTVVNENAKSIILMWRLLQPTSLSLNLFPDYEPEALHIVEQFYVSVKSTTFFFSPARTLQMIQLLSQHTLFILNNACWKQRIQSLCTITLNLLQLLSALSPPFNRGEQPDIPFQQLFSLYPLIPHISAF